MKTTQYFRHARQRPDRAIIKDEWIEYVIRNPLKEVHQLTAELDGGHVSLKCITAYCELFFLKMAKLFTTPFSIEVLRSKKPCASNILKTQTLRWWSFPPEHPLKRRN